MAFSQETSFQVRKADARELVLARASLHLEQQQLRRYAFVQIARGLRVQDDAFVHDHDPGFAQAGRKRMPEWVSAHAVFVLDRHGLVWVPDRDWVFVSEPVAKDVRQRLSVPGDGLVVCARDRGREAEMPVARLRQTLR